MLRSFLRGFGVAEELSDSGLSYVLAGAVVPVVVVVTVAVGGVVVGGGAGDASGSISGGATDGGGFKFLSLLLLFVEASAGVERSSAFISSWG